MSGDQGTARSSLPTDETWLMPLVAVNFIQQTEAGHVKLAT